MKLRHHSRLLSILITLTVATATTILGQDYTPANASADAVFDEGDIVRRYAPLVHLHPGDNDHPMSAGAFLEGSTLKWSHDGGSFFKSCRDKDIGPIDLSKLKNGQYWHQKASSLRINRYHLPTGCKHEGRFYSSNERTRPRDGVAGQEGFYLDLNNDLRKGEGTNAPVYYKYQPNHFITYWFLYGFNDSGRVGSGGNHEGDWERVSVLLDKRNQPTKVVFYRHGAPCMYPWAELLFFDGHPTVYSANGSHASYWKIGKFDRPKAGVVTGKDYTSGMGPIWKTWDHLVEIESQPWYNYGGAWGEIGAASPIYSKLTTGPVGPRHQEESPGGPDCR